MLSNPINSLPIFRAYLNPTNHLTATATATATAAVAFRFRHRFLLRTSLESAHLSAVPQLNDIFHGRILQFNRFSFCHWSFLALSDALMGLSFFNGDDRGRSDANNVGSNLQSKTPRRDLFNERGWTTILLATNVLVYVAQYFSKVDLLYWGAKINSLISEGQIWRLATSSFLHANIGHLLVNCYSLNSVGPTVENICGPKRFLTIYLTSAITSSAMSYWLCKAPAVGASGAIFGLVGSFAMFILRHRGMVKGAEGDLKHIGQVIFLNMTIGLLSQGIDNWGHVGGLIGGAAVSWLVGPAWEVNSRSRDGRTSFRDNAPIFSLFRKYPK
ncbi:RHOMBOID-like protein 10, chloroplastic [Andrographis paniculata]|uniref:RHOMBOID-like protein 10, chloroplastic n=1 Tax=Andrographis paniculata TaxID=175694 RepID=UPI0021E79E84|nr:RHOMBOID-like protein 10, chloroplastic [Andrographis paniculata]